MKNEERKPASTAATTAREKARLWATSHEGQKRITESAQRSRELTVELSKARQLDPKKLDEPITL
jgi:hypothetical protein